VQIVAALEAGDTALAEKLMAAHIGSVKDALRLQPVAADEDPLSGLRDALAPVAKNSPSPSPPAKSDGKPVPPETPATYLGALL
jgi:hypothetical protein